MVFGGEEPKISSCPKKDRDELVKLGLLEVVKRGRASHLLLTDRAWEQAPTLLAAEADAGDQHELLALVLRTVCAYTQRYDVAIADFVRPAKREECSVVDQIRSEYLARTGGRYAQRVRLADLRERVRASRDAVDRALTEIVASGSGHLLSLDDPLDRFPRDEAAAVSVGGHPRHLLYLERP